jgi:hypothetical protein
MLPRDRSGPRCQEDADLSCHAGLLSEGNLQILGRAIFTSLICAALFYLALLLGRWLTAG